MLRFRKSLTSAVLAATLGVLAFAGCSERQTMIAEYPHYATVEEAVAASDLIVVGEVQKSHEEQTVDTSEGAHEVGPFTVTEILVSETLKGSAPDGDEILVAQLGTRRHVEENTVLLSDLSGQQVVLFLSDSTVVLMPINAAVGVQALSDQDELTSAASAAGNIRTAAFNISLDRLREVIADER